MKWTVRHPDPVVPVAVRFDLPYCLHLQDATYVVDVDGVPIEIHTEKVWRNSEGSSEDDTVADEAIVFHEGELLSGTIGGDPSAASQLVGKNMEFGGDATGYFRHTRMVIGLTIPSDVKPEERGLEIARTAVQAANRFVDVYRYVTGRAYLPHVRVEDLRYMEVSYPLTGELEYVALFLRGLRIALINEPRQIHEQVQRMAEAGEQVPIHADLLLASIRALWETDHRLATFEAVAALDVFVEGLLRKELMESGRMTEDEFRIFMADDGRTLSDKMKKPLRAARDASPADDTELWDRWRGANAVRRAVVHAGHLPTADEAKEVVRTVQDLLTHLGDEGMHLAEEMPE